MDSFTADEESQFFDALEHIGEKPDSISDAFPSVGNREYDLWTNAPQSVGERRESFFRRIGLGLCEMEREIVGICDDSIGDYVRGDVQRIVEDSGAVLRTCSIEDEFSSSRSSVSSWDTDSLGLSPQRVDLCECREGDVYSSGECGMENERLGRTREMGSDISSRGLDSPCQFSPTSQEMLDREDEVSVYTPKSRSKLKRRWLRRLRSMTCMMSGGMKEENVGSCVSGHVQGRRTWRVRVRHCQRRRKELSALFTGQEIQAHEGSILAMKFSLDGQYLASAGEDKIVRIWQVVEDERLDTVDIPDADPSCVYFSVNHLSELGPLMVEKDKLNKSKSRRRTQDSACIVFPSKVFRIFEKPLHVFQGHSGEILDLSWSKDNVCYCLGRPCHCVI